MRDRLERNMQAKSFVPIVDLVSAIGLASEDDLKVLDRMRKYICTGQRNVENAEKHWDEFAQTLKRAAQQ